MESDARGYYVPLEASAESPQPSKAALGLVVEEPVAGFPIGAEQAGIRPFRTGLFDVCADPDICCYGFFCTPCLYGQNVRHLKELHGKPGGTCLSPCCTVVALSGLANIATCSAVSAVGVYAAGGAAIVQPATSMSIQHLAGNLGDLAGGCVSARRTYKSRTSLRRKFGISEHPWLSDFCAHFWCCACAVCQEAREIREYLSDSAAQRDMIWHTACLPPGAQVMSLDSAPVDVSTDEFSAFSPSKAKPF